MLDGFLANWERVGAYCAAHNSRDCDDWQGLCLRDTVAAAVTLPPLRSTFLAAPIVVTCWTIFSSGTLVEPRGRRR